MRTPRFTARRHTTSVWANRLVRSLAGQWGTTDNPTVLRSLGQLIPLDAAGPKKTPRDDTETGPDRVHEWTRSGQLAYGEAELLLVLDESTPWRGST